MSFAYSFPFSESHDGGGSACAPQGLRKVEAALSPVVTAHDDHIAKSCQEQHLNCFKMRRPILAQDMYWPSKISPNELAPAVTTGYAIYDGVDNQGAARVGNRHELHWYRRLCQEMSYQVLPVNMDLTRVSFRWV